ncbi:hypothetical protein Golax_015797 [Gossypium laxum]|uniref:Disease resistance R13L4/SHOC-2-like LRR domain-containing protein n=1 Tax=Gossypium laxum TaxID=34288 RepID=A0A7J8YV69_9ROSI|nr:hypothetical protein [Gossypium laxum]
MGQARDCRVRDLMREVILSKWDELNLIQTLVGNLESFKGKARHLSLYDRANNNFPGSSSKSQVHSIIAFQVDFKFLKEVDFAGVPLSYVSEELGDLLHLRYSSLRGENATRVHSAGVDTLEGDEFCVELGRLKKLKKLGSSMLKPKHGVAFCTAIEQMNKRQSLSITSIKDEEFLQLQSMSYPPVSLRKLCLRGRLTKLPNWVSKVHNLVRIGLHWSRISDDSLKILGVLPKLLKLTIDEGAFPSLEWLSIGPSPYLEELPWTISCLNSLKHLALHNMPVPHSFARRLVPNEGTDHWKVKHIPNAVFCYTNGSMQSYVYKLGDQRLLQLRDLLCFMQESMAPIAEVHLTQNDGGKNPK